MDLHTHANPFNKPPCGGAQAESFHISKELLQEVRREDAAMAEDVAALAPRRGHVLRSGVSTTNVSDGVKVNGALARAGTSSAACGGSASYSVDVHDTLTTSEFVQQKREVGLVRMSLSTKKAEIRKLDEKINRAEKRLRQQQEQLTNTREKFNSFLKFSNLEQDAAVRRADDETRNKHAKTIEIKKLSALISHAEAEMRKTRVQIENCVAYKDFLESLAAPQWFYDTLINLRVEDATEKILLDSEESYQARSAALVAQEAARVEALEREEEAKKLEAASGGKRNRAPIVEHSQRKGKLQDNATSLVEVEEPTVVPLEEQLEHLYSSVEEEARAAIAAATATIRAEVGAMTVADVKEELRAQYDEKRLPLCFASVDDLLEVFINVEEGNLFLIQNCHELEEELEGVEISYMQEREEMNTMVDQRTAQLKALASSVAEAQKKLQALDERMEALEPHGTSQANATAGSTATSKRAKAGASSIAATWDTASVASTTKMSPEELKKRVEESIEHIFHLLRTGDQQLKTPAQNSNLRKNTDGAKNSGNPSHHRLRTASAVQRDSKSVRFSPTQTGNKNAANGDPSSDLKQPPSAVHKLRKSSSRVGAAVAVPEAASQQQHHDASMGPVEMLTIIENKLEEYHRYLSDPANGVELALMKAVMKQSDKQRRRQARIIHLASQENEQEERIRRALERSQAPIIHKIGKPVRPRSFVSKSVDEKSRRKSERSAALNGSLDNIDSDEDGAEFFM